MKMFEDQLPREESEEDLAAARENAGTRVRVWRARSIYAAGAFILSCILEAPFSKVALSTSTPNRSEDFRSIWRWDHFWL